MGILQSLLKEVQQTSTQQDASADPEELRRLAHEQATLRGEAFDRSKQCYQRGDHEGAARWSAAGKRHDQLMDQYNAQASEAAFRRVNPTSDLARIDLHGLFVKEAEERMSQRIRECRSAGVTRIEVIVGKGLHSHDGVAKIKPAIIRLVEEHNLRCTVDPENAGVVWVELVSEKERGLFGWLCDRCCVQ